MEEIDYDGGSDDDGYEGLPDPIHMNNQVYLRVGDQRGRAERDCDYYNKKLRQNMIIIFGLIWMIVLLLVVTSTTPKVDMKMDYNYDEQKEKEKIFEVSCVFKIKHS